MSQYVYVGASECVIWDTPFKFSRFGQVAEIPDAVALKAIAHRAALLPKADFDALGFTADELKKYAKSEMHHDAPGAFLEKRKAAWKKLHEPKSAPAPAPETPKPASLNTEPRVTE